MLSFKIRIIIIFTISKNDTKSIDAKINRNYKNFQIPIGIHNSGGYDTHLIIKELPNIFQQFETSYRIRCVTPGGHIILYGMQCIINKNQLKGCVTRFYL